MSPLPLRFIHAGDFHLEQPAHGLAEVPAHLRETLLECPYRAAARVFDAALAEDVDLVVLTGNVVNVLTAGPRAIVFLHEQFKRLAQREIDVYWVTGGVDLQHDVRAVNEWPANVHFFPSISSGQFLHTRGGRPIARLVGQSGGGDTGLAAWRDAQPFDQRERHGVHDELFTIGVSCGCVASDDVEQHGVDYLAAGGSHAHQIITAGKPVAAVSGSPQGRCPDEEGPHGCLLVEVDATGTPRARLLATDVLRWQSAEIAINEATRQNDLESAIVDCLRDFQDEAQSRTLLISCHVVGGASAAQWASNTSLAAEMLASVRQRLGQTETSVWPVAVSARQVDPLPQAYYEQDTILGEFLRLNQRYQDELDEPLDVRVLDLDSDMDQEQKSQLNEILKLTGEQRRRQVLQKTALLGASLLGADDEQHAEATNVSRPRDQEAA